MISGLLILKHLCLKFEYELDEQNRIPLIELLKQTLEPMGNLINDVVNLESEFALTTLYLITKIFHICNHINLCSFLKDPQTLDPWMQFLKSMLDRPIEKMDINYDEGNKHTSWKFKGVAASLT